MNVPAALVLGLCIALGAAGASKVLSDGAVRIREYERTVTAKGLAEREYPADIVIWPIRFAVADNDLTALYQHIEDQTARIRSYLTAAGVTAEAISLAAPAVTDKHAQQYGGGERSEFRYAATQTVTVYARDIPTVRKAMPGLAALGKQGIALVGENYDNKPEYIFERLNEIKPEMIEEATTNAREVAHRFAVDSSSRLGKIKRASQGQFSISARDKNNEHIKKIRVVSTVEYYLVD